MVEIMPYTTDFYDEVNKEGNKLVLYGAGNEARKVYPYLPKVSFVCDQAASKQTLSFFGHRVITLEQLSKMEETFIILISIKKGSIREAIKSEIKNKCINAKVFELHNNISFDVFQPIEKKNSRGSLRNINIVCYDNEGWILRKFAERLTENLNLLGYNAVLNECIDKNADINHHIQFGYEGIAGYRDTIMFSHVNSLNLLEKVKHELKTAEMGICMSRETMNSLAMMGVPRNKLCYINPAHDETSVTKKYVFGITHRCYDNYDFRKRDGMIVDLCRNINSKYFKFVIMGARWEAIIEKMQEMGFEVDYYPEFDYEKYWEIMPSLDYYLYQGFDEGSMGILDALSVGVKTIVTPQGFHMDISNGITYACRSLGDFVEVCKELETEREKLIASVSDWTWKKYAEKHAEVWNYLLGNYENLFKNQHLYEDGIFSVLRIDA